MEEINFITTNNGKISTLKKILKNNNLNIEVIATKLDIYESQANTVNEVSKSKALQAYNILKKSVLVEDTGFYIKALNNFPGVYAKYILSTIGVDGILKLMEGKTDRRAEFYSCTTYINENGELFQFENDILEDNYGYIAEKKSELPCPSNAHSELCLIYQLNQNNKPTNSFPQEKKLEFETEAKTEKTSMYNFVKWVEKNSF